MPGKAFWGSGSASVSAGGTIEQCQALCSSTTNCSGATYNPTAYGQPMCFLRTGEGQLVPALDTDVAIIPEAQKYLLIIESINNKLISTNQQIQNVINQSQPIYNSMKTEGQEQNKELIQNYMKLVAEREKIAETLKSYEDLDKSEQEGEMRVTQKQYSYILLVIIALGVIVLLYKFSGVLTSESGSSQTYNQTGGELPQSTYYVLLIIIILIILFNYYSNIKKTTTDASNSVYSGFSSVFGGIFSFFSLSDN
jgi:preprotein translocase subunit SecG